MYTEYFGPIDRENLKNSSHFLEAAARKLQQGGLIAFPTETTYGLGAAILNQSALSLIYKVKNRNFASPLPVQVAHFDQAKFIASDIPEEAHFLAKTFLPGPLTIILKKNKNLPDIICAGKETVAIRISSDPIARRLIELTGCPLAVPSANISGKPSAIKANHVLEDFNGLIDGVVDGGAAEYGMESTLISLEDPKHPIILRFGLISQKEIERALNRKVTMHPSALMLNRNAALGGVRSAIRLFSSSEEVRIYLKLSAKSKRMIMSDKSINLSEGDHFQLSSNNLYEGLRLADRSGYAEVLVVCTPELKKNTLLLNRLKQIAQS